MNIKHFLNRKNYPTMWGFWGLGFLLILPAVNCGKSEDPELKETIQFVRYISTKPQLEKSSFLLVAKEIKPSGFVEWMFSPLGTAEWIPPNSMEFSADELKMMKKSGLPMLPQNVFVVPHRPDPKKLGKQVVVKADDVRHMLIVEGYLNPHSKPVLSRQWKLPVIL